MVQVLTFSCNLSPITRLYPKLRIPQLSHSQTVNATGDSVDMLLLQEYVESRLGSRMLDRVQDAPLLTILVQSYSTP
ncbi:MAG: hypothetical protein F4X82_00530 [Candidatus Spechtbacteria bacterium SB0662_bin_43]|uniref:Uncharacterized protein n=1 Tax=Candidatus Spechtbacteria bacterium SB0662_bin_43 TaxID=2604897 RepID=A0A845DBH7_9BACT|nr:hypothetical protein [Candidatus Spechtbacteria bacterium SB0662_bin_43]